MPFTVKKLTQVDTSSPDAVGKSLVNLAKYTEDEFGQVASAMQDTFADHVWNKAPPRPRRGTYVYADGTNWNPGYGEGPYWFDGTLYHPMGQGSAPFDAMASDNLFINGNMQVSQENGTSVISITAPPKYVVDGWGASWVHAGAAFGAGQTTNTGGGLPGMPSYINLQATTAIASVAAGDYAMIYQPIEGYRMAALAWGTANALPLTLGFVVDVQAGTTISVAVRNAANNRSYVTNVSVIANQWNYVTVTIPGDTTGTWAIDNTIGAFVSICFCCGSTFQAASANTWSAGNFIGTSSTSNCFATNNNTVFLNGAFALPGSGGPVQARWPFMFRPLPVELPLCQRYYQKSYDLTTVPGTVTSTGMSAVYVTGVTTAGNSLSCYVKFAPYMRIAPTCAVYSTVTGAKGLVRDAQNSADVTGSIDISGQSGFRWYAQSSAAVSVVNLQAHWTADARL